LLGKGKQYLDEKGKKGIYQSIEERKQRLWSAKDREGRKEGRAKKAKLGLYLF
jgi:hypothetical protein